MNQKCFFRALYKRRDYKCLNNLSSPLYTIFLIYRTDKSNSSANGSKQILSISRRLRIARSRSPRIHSSMSADNSEFDKSSMLIFFFSCVFLLRNGLYFLCVSLCIFSSLSLSYLLSPVPFTMSPSSPM